MTAFIEKTLEKSPRLAACLSSTELDVYGDMAAKGLQAALAEYFGQPHISRKQMDDTIMPWISALLGKASALDDCLLSVGFRRAATAQNRGGHLQSADPKNQYAALSV